MKKILLVEDDKALQKLIVYNFQKEGFNIETVNDGEEALYFIKENYADLILLDWMLPNISGIEIARQLKLNKKSMEKIWSRYTNVCTRFKKNT